MMEDDETGELAYKQKHGIIPHYFMHPSHDKSYFELKLHIRARLCLNRFIVTQDGAIHQE